MERVDCVVIGAGVIGLAIARQLAMAGREVLVLEAAGMIGTETSSRNSEVIHAGIYYPTGSLKARTCVAGKHRLYAYCAERGVPHARCGKLCAHQGPMASDRVHADGKQNVEGGDPRDLPRRGGPSGTGTAACDEPLLSRSRACMSRLSRAGL